MLFRLQGSRRSVVIGNPSAGDGIETVWHLDQVNTPRSRTHSFALLQSPALNRRSSARQPVIHERTFRKPISYIVVGGLQPAKTTQRTTAMRKERTSAATRCITVAQIRSLARETKS